LMPTWWIGAGVIDLLDEQLECSPEPSAWASSTASCR
jgi:hypothetical protein